MASKKILTDGLTNKQRILRMVEGWDDDIPFKQALYHMYVMKELMEGIESAEEEELIDHDELFDELERLCDEEENAAQMVEKSPKRSKGPTDKNRRERHKNGQEVRKQTKRIRKRAS
ncbi:MAG TPA: hypothetical protein VFE62_02255 [Gemmataceae bacterium]|nr:hypothetical protein [Gemmataceae bacterium]